MAREMGHRWLGVSALGVVCTACGSASVPPAHSASETPAISTVSRPTPTAPATPQASRAVTSDDGLVSFAYPSQWSATNCTSPPWLTGNGSPTQPATFLFQLTGSLASTCDYSQIGLVTAPTDAACPWIAVSEEIQPGDTDMWSTCGEALISQADVRSADGTSGVKFSYEPTSAPSCGGPPQRTLVPYSGPPLGFLTVYRFPLTGSQHFAYCVVQDRESASSPDERQSIETLVTQTLRIK